MSPLDIWGKIVLGRGKNSTCKGSILEVCKERGQCGWNRITEGQNAEIRGPSNGGGGVRGWMGNHRKSYSNQLEVRVII